MVLSAGGIISRLARESDGELVYPPTTEYLELDGATPVWTRERKRAVFFEQYLEADDRAVVLHACALVTSKPMPRTQEVLVNVPAAPLHPAAVLAQEAIRERKRKQPMRDRKQMLRALQREQEQREEDLRELERIETE